MQTHSSIAVAATRSRCPFAQPIAHDALSPVEEAIAGWRLTRQADAFPYDTVVAEYRRVGKHFVAKTLLAALVDAREELPAVRGAIAGVDLLARFLDNALDKWDGRYANPTYLGLNLLPLPAVDDLGQEIVAVERVHDRLLVHLIADAMRFELTALDGATDQSPQMRADARTTAKRCRLGLQITGPAAARLGLAVGVDVNDPIAGARRLVENVTADQSAVERRTLDLTMLPVSLVHDEYQFIRILQAFEATFALVAVELRHAIQALAGGKGELARERIESAAAALREAAPLFSLVATMQIAAFQTFREFTEGASAIQSRHYKLVESLCRQPERSRLDSAAYTSVPEVRERILAGQVTLEEALAAVRAGRLSARGASEVEDAMRGLAAALLRWRRTHHSLAVRMLGERTGTGYTEGAAYLKAAMAIPVFASLPHEDSGAAGEEMAEASAAPVVGRGRCPFASGHATAARPG